MTAAAPAADTTLQHSFTMAAKKQTSIERFFTKRRKINDSASTDEDAAKKLLFNPTPNCLNDLPIGALSHVSTFLAPPSRALFATAIHTLRPADASVIFPSNLSIYSSSMTFQEISAQLEQKYIQKILWKIEALHDFDPEWPITLDFDDIGKEHATKLSDDGMEAVLLSIDCMNTVGKLILTYCINITGVGLAPIQNSKIIQQIDMSMAGNNQSPLIYSEPSLSTDAVIPILYGMINQDGCALKHVEFPMKWRQALPPTPPRALLNLFVAQYNQYLTSRIDVPCAECNATSIEEGWMDVSAYNHASQKYTCYSCLGHYCESPRYCSLCTKLLCDNCQGMDQCDICHNIYCVECTEGRFKGCSICRSVVCKECSYSGHCFGCDKDFCDNDCITRYDCSTCGKGFCSDCQDTFWKACEYCNANFCNECNDMNGSVTNGVDCDKPYCGTCRVGSYR